VERLAAIKEMMNGECGMMNWEIKAVAFIHRSSFRVQRLF
jgi:hypothetical protein